MKKTLIVLMLFVVGVALYPTAAVFADIPGNELPEFAGNTAGMTFDLGAVNLDEEPEPEPDEPGPELAE